MCTLAGLGFKYLQENVRTEKLYLLLFTAVSPEGGQLTLPGKYPPKKQPHKEAEEIHLKYSMQILFSIINHSLCILEKSHSDFFHMHSGTET